MRAMLVTCLLSLPALGAAPAADLLVWGGGTTREDAERWLTQWNDEAKDWARFLTLAPGFPRVDDATTVKGLKPGFFIVTLGVCSPKQATSPLAVLKAMAERTYARRVALEPPKDACPSTSATAPREQKVSPGPGDTRVHLARLKLRDEDTLLVTSRTKDGRRLSFALEPGQPLPAECVKDCFGGDEPDALVFIGEPRKAGCAEVLTRIVATEKGASSDDEVVQTCD